MQVNLNKAIKGFAIAAATSAKNFLDKNTAENEVTPYSMANSYSPQNKKPFALPALFGTANSDIYADMQQSVKTDEQITNFVDKLNNCKNELLSNKPLSKDSSSLLNSFEKNYSTQSAKGSPYLSKSGDVVNIYDLNVPVMDEKGRLQFKPATTKDRFLHKMASPEIKELNNKKLDNAESISKISEFWGQGNFLKEQAPELFDQIQSSAIVDNSFAAKYSSSKQNVNSR